MTVSRIVWPLSLLLAFVAGMAVSAQTPRAWPWSASMDAVHADPAHHKVLFENDDIRILEVTNPPGSREQPHTHQWSSVFVVDSSPEFTVHWQCQEPAYCGEGKDIHVNRPPANATRPSMLRRGPEGPHYITNDDSVAAHGYKIEYKKLHFVSSDVF